MNKNICFVLTLMESGGLQRNAAILANHFVHTGHQVSICCLYSTECFFKLDERIKLLDFSSNKNKFLSMGYWKKKLHQYFIDNKVDTVISFGERCGIITSMAKGKLSINHICRGVITDNSFINKTLLKIYLKGIDKFVFQTKAQKEQFDKKIRDKGVEIANPFQLLGTNINKNGINSKRFITVAMFRLKQKKQDLMVKAFSLFIKEHPDYIFEMYGKYNKEEKEYMDSLIKEYHLENKAILMGENKNIKEVIVPSRAFICASTSEGMPNAIIEALSYGIPVITSKWNGYNEVIDYEINGLTFDIDNVEQMTNQMARIADDDALFTKLSNNAIKHKISEFSEEVVLNKWNQII
ncbi:MAG: glycosyltransferase [Bacilli bacterium]|nr:glycosyltransferase [Bacilli bacterium]